MPLFNWVNALPAVGTSKHSTPFLGILWTVDPTNLAIGAAFVKVKKLPAAQQRAYAVNFTVLLLVDNAHLMSMSSRPGSIPDCSEVIQNSRRMIVNQPLASERPNGIQH